MQIFKTVVQGKLHNNYKKITLENNSFTAVNSSNLLLCF